MSIGGTHHSSDAEDSYRRPHRRSGRHRSQRQRRINKRRITKAIFMAVVVMISLGAAYLLSG